MSKKASTTAIGAFVIGAVFLAVAGIVMFGSGNYFTKKYNYVIYFQGSVKGLNVGAPVLFKGVKVGEVTDIKMEFDGKKMAFRIPVFIQLTDGKTDTINIEYLEDFKEAGQDDFMIELMNRGLRAQIAPQSFITGLLYIKLDFFPELELRLLGVESLSSDPELIEIPAAPSDMEMLAKTFENIPIKQIARNLEDMTRSVQSLVGSPKIPSILNSVDETMVTFNQTMVDLQAYLASISIDLKTAIHNTNRLVRNANRQVEPMATGFIETTDAATGALKRAQETLSLEKGPGADLVDSVRKSFETATTALEQANTTLQNIEDVSNKDSEVIYSLNKSLEEIAMAARSIRTVADYLERHPESLLRGKGGKGGN